MKLVALLNYKVILTIFFICLLSACLLFETMYFNSERHSIEQHHKIENKIISLCAEKVKLNINDPTSFLPDSDMAATMHQGTGINRGYTIVSLPFRAKNGFNALMLETVYCRIILNDDHEWIVQAVTKDVNSLS